MDRPPLVVTFTMTFVSAVRFACCAAAAATLELSDAFTRIRLVDVFL